MFISGGYDGETRPSRQRAVSGLRAGIACITKTYSQRANRVSAPVIMPLVSQAPTNQKPGGTTPFCCWPGGAPDAEGYVIICKANGRRRCHGSNCQRSEHTR